MALVTRLSRLFQADFHAVLDRIEEPDLQLRQAVREMQEVITDDDQQMRLLQTEQQHTARRITELKQSLLQIEEELDICFAADKQDLARQTVRRKLEQQQRLQLLEQQQEHRKQQIDELTAGLAEYRQQLQAIQEKADCLLENSAAQSEQVEPFEIGVHDRDVEVALLREQQRRAS